MEHYPSCRRTLLMLVRTFMDKDIRYTSVLVTHLHLSFRSNEAFQDMYGLQLLHTHRRSGLIESICFENYYIELPFGMLGLPDSPH